MVPVEAMVATVFVVGILWAFKRKYKQILNTVNPKEGLWYIKTN
ncbi:exonuclease subunit 1 [Proteus phage 309]|uniref:Exonuclease subunit 1 n=1 Tax=Proteus phage 309 TaxID=2894355 RepID=A0AAE8YHN5_9CAUD|nr:exonuclease subunit 1 [Proteus phage 309]